MRDELPDVPALRPLDPPPGGLARLRAALDGEPRRESRVRWAFAGASLAVIGVVWFALAARRDTGSSRADLVVVVPRPAPPPVADPTIAAPAVSFYWVSSRPAPVDAPAEPAAPTPALPLVTFRGGR
jgi:hypothetical protein